MPAASKPIRTSAPQIKGLLAKTGRFILMSEQYDKLEAVVELVERINDKLDHGTKMELKLSDLNAFLSREEITEELDIKGCVSKLLQFVHSQRERLAEYAHAHVDGEKKQADADKVLHDLLKLWGMEYQEVEKCFEIEVYSPKRDRDVEATDGLANENKRQRIGDRSVDVDQPAEMALAVEMDLAVVPGQTRPVEDSAERALALVTRQARLVEDLQRLVPASILVIEDGSAGDALADRRALAQAEVERILQADSKGNPILLGDTIDKRRQAFRTIIRLLHPSVGLVSTDDERAMQAVRLSLEAFMKSELSEE
jgi:hypothetical protein